MLSCYLSLLVDLGVNKHLPLAEPSVTFTITVKSVDDGLLRTSTGCVGPSSSSTMYVDWLKLTVISVEM